MNGVMFGETTNREQLGWQLRAVRLLDQLLQHAHRDELPPVTWTVGNAGAMLVARCHGRRGTDRRAEWEAWRAVLAATPWPEHVSAGGVIHLHAIAKRVDGLVDVAVIADVFPNEGPEVPMATTAITIEFDVDQLAGYTDEHLALLWHVAQANPADGFEDQTAGDVAEKIGREIIRRWLRGVEPELYRHQGRHYYAHQLRKFATYQPPADATSGGPEWHHGEWVPRGTDAPEVTQ